MTRKFILVSCSLFVIVVAFTSCTRVQDYPLKNICRIASMTGYTFYDSAVPRHFFYNDQGNPTRVAFDESPGTGTPFYDFFYNEHQRLTRFEEFSVHNYTYNEEGLAVIDTIFAGYAGGDFRYEEKMFYDDAQRIIKTVTTLYFPEDHEEYGIERLMEYKYDDNGNLIRPGVTYDGKVNAHRTNKVWMLVDKDYSMNNPLPGPTAYNALGLPLNKVDFLGYSTEDIIYDCKFLNRNEKLK